MFKFKVFLLLFFSSVLITGGFTHRHALACELVEYSNYSEVSPNIFISSSFDLGKKYDFLSTVNLGKSVSYTHLTLPTIA